MIRHLPPRTDVGGVRHYELPSGELVPSVTSIISRTPVQPKTPIAPAMWASSGTGLAEAARGSDVHRSIERWLLTGEDPPLRPSGWWQSFERFKPSVGSPLLIEGAVWNEPMSYAGTVDAVIRLQDGRVAIADWTTLRPSPREVSDKCLQLAAYSAAMALTYPQERAAWPQVGLVVVLREGVMPQVYELDAFTMARSLAAFFVCLTSFQERAAA